MTLWQRISQILIGMVMLLFSTLLIIIGEKAYHIIIIVYSLTLELIGIRMLIYYYAMARHMVGGWGIFCRGFLSFDFGLFAGTLVKVPHIYILIYLTGILAFSGIVDLLRARESKGIQGPWKLKTTQGIIEIILAVFCLIFMHSAALVVEVFSLSFMFSGIMRIINAFRRTPVITID